MPKDPSINIKLSDLGRDIMTPTMESAMMHEINQQCKNTAGCVNFMKWMTFTPSATNSRKRALILKKWQEEVLNNDP